MKPGKRSSEEWVAAYALSHRHPFNRWCHTIGIPMITVSIPLFVVIMIFRRDWWVVPVALYAAGWVLQFIGHAVEGTRPEFLRDWRFLFVGLRWWYAKIRGRL